MKRAVILHGTMGSPQGNWFPWLKAKLEQQDYEVWLPSLPHADHPSLCEWASFVADSAPFNFDQDTLIVGHSSGAILSLILAQGSNQQVGAVVAVSVFHDNSLNWDANDRLFDVPINFDLAKKNTNKLLFIHSDTDPYVPLEQAQYVSSKCEAEMLVIPGQGHFNLEQSDAYTQFPALLKLLKARNII